MSMIARDRMRRKGRLEWLDGITTRYDHDAMPLVVCVLITCYNWGDQSDSFAVAFASD